MPRGIKFEPTAEQVRWIAEVYPCTKNAELCAALGIGRGALINHARRNGLQKSPEYLKTQCRLYPGHKRSSTPEARAKISMKVRTVIKSERRRVLFGLPQRTRLRVVRQNRGKVRYRYNMRQLGYLELPGEKNGLRYPSEEMRHRRAEANAARHGIKIMPIGDGQ